MAENTRISWATHTFNPWIGCTRLSPACDNCYAAAWAARFPRTRQAWAGELVPAADSAWAKPVSWNKLATSGFEDGCEVRVFCASLCDVFDNQAPQAWRDRLWALIEATPALTWMLLTKRPQNVGRMIPPAWLNGNAPSNVMLGITAEDQPHLDQRGFLALQLGTLLGWRTFVSAEPLLGPLDFTAVAIPGDHPGHINALTGGCAEAAIRIRGVASFMVGLDTYRPFAEIITGGESGPHARLHHPEWHRRIRDDCRAAGVAYHFKQWGEWIEVDQHTGPLRGDAAFVTPAGDRRDRQHAAPGDALMIRAGARAAPILDGDLHGERDMVWMGVDVGGGEAF